MPWLRGGDNAATYPKVMTLAAVRGSDDRTVNEVFGWLVRCMMQSAGHMTDYVIDAGTAAMLGGSRTAELVRLSKKVGLLKSVTADGVAAFQLHDDPEFLHMRLRAEVEWERQRKRDNANPALTGPVRLRDGDVCRYCQVITWWGTNDRSSRRVGTYDHLEPGKPGKVPTVVVACRGCNSKRQDDTETLELQPEPIEPFYSAATAAYLQKHLGISVPVSSQRPGSQSDTAPAQRPGRRPANADTQRLGSQPDTAQRPGPAPDTAHPEDEVRSADSSGSEAGFTGSGRDGLGRAGTGRGGTRGRRGHRGRTADELRRDQ